LRGFGHHGECDSFNGCVDAATCAEAACRQAGLGAPLSWREGGCLDVPELDCDLFNALPDDLDEAWVPGCNIPVAYDVVCLGGPPPACGDGTVDPGEDCDDGNVAAGDGCAPDCTIEAPIEILVGPQTNVSIGGLNLGGFELCHTETYATQFDADAVRAQCPGATWIVGCRPVGADRLTVAAMGLQATIFEPVANEANAAQVHNESRWYYGENYSFGFAPPNGGLNRVTCDTAGDQAELRMCWHTIDRGGWRCGATTRLNNSEAWERVILQTAP
jgi:cysteine-rich repeat protein